MPQINTFSEAQDILRPYYDNSRTAYTLDLMQGLMKFLGNPQDKLRVLHVAGTSGKTSTAYYCAALLKASGKTVGLSVSPHVDTVNERLQINGVPVSEAEFCRALGEFIDVVDTSGLKPSYFELLVALAYWYFERQGVDYVVMEVGLGGLLDGTNVVTNSNKICLITDIGFDHTEILGDTLAKIAAQKAGIIQDGNKIFVYEQDNEVMQVVLEAVSQHAATLRILHDDEAVPINDLPLFQQRNLGLASAAVDAVLRRDENRALPAAAIDEAAGIVVPARLERRQVGDKTVIIDGSHNQQKINTLLQSVANLYPGQDIAALCAFVQGNDERWQGGIQELLPAVKHIVFTTFHGEQDLPKSSVASTKIVKFCQDNNFSHCETIDDPAAAYRALLQRPEPVLLITGSFYLLNHVRPLLQESA